MLKSMGRLLGHIALAIAGCLAMVGYATAAESLTSYHLRALALDFGAYGAESAEFKAKLAHMQAIKEDRTSDTNGLITLKNGFVQAFLMKSGVAEGKTGVGAGALA